MSKHFAQFMIFLVISMASATGWAVPERFRCAKFLGRTDGPGAMSDKADEVACLINADRPQSLDVLATFITEWKDPSNRFGDGRPTLAALRRGYIHAFAYQEHDWSRSRTRVDAIKNRFPNSAFAALTEAGYWIAYAWNARGTGYGATVTSDGWRLFKERMETAERVLIQSKPVASTLPIWYELMIEVQTGLSRPTDERYKTFFEGATRFKTYYPLYFEMENSLEPKWGGTWRDVDKLVSWSVNNTKETDGQLMYARLYWVASHREEKKQLFSQTRVNWPKMKKGFEDLMERHPTSKWNLNNFAAFACAAGDKKTFRALRQQIGDDVISFAWPKDCSLDLCEQKYGRVK